MWECFHISQTDYNDLLYVCLAAAKEVLMSNLIPGNQKHLTLNDRLYIEHALDEGHSFRDIAKYLCKDPTTISREVRLHRSLDTWHKGSFNNPYNFCIHRFKCRKTNVCKKLLICDQKCASCHKCNQVCDRFEKEACLKPMPQTTRNCALWTSLWMMVTPARTLNGLRSKTCSGNWSRGPSTVFW